MTSANIQFVIGVLDVVLRILSVVAAMGVVFLFSLHSFAARTVRPAPVETAPRPRAVFPKPEPFVLRSTRGVAPLPSRRAA